MPATRNILIVDRAAPSLARDLEAHGFVCETRRDITYDEFLHLPDTLCGLVIRSRFRVDKPLIDSKPHLRFIARLGSGVENIDTDYAESRGIACINTPEGNANAVAEHALGLLLSALRNIPKSDREVRGGEWLREANKGTELASQKVGIIGYGHTGPAFARILHTFGTKVYVYDKFRTDINDNFVTVVDLPTILRECNVISLHINYLPENHHFVNDAFLDAARNGIILLNTCRGLVVDTAALVSHLRNGKVRYACLDVLEYESVRLKIPPKNEWEAALLQLSEMENVILTPHLAGQTLEAEQRHADIAVQKILKLSE